MDKVNLVDFDISIERVEGGYRARVINSPVGSATANFTLPFSGMEMENLMLKLSQPRRGVRGLESQETETAKTFGGKLYNAVFVDEVKSCLRSSLDEVSQKDAGLRIRLRLSDAPELANLPWEYLFNPSLNRFLTLSKDTPLVRYLDLPERILPLKVKPPLRMLVMISSPKDYPPLDVELEWQKLNDSLSKWVKRGLISMTRLESASLMALQRQLRADDYHIFHFIGHGGFDQQAQDGILLLETEDGRGHPISGQNLGTILHDERTLRLAVLNACEGARASRSDPFGGVAQSLVQQGIPAVIGMQFEISDAAAITFSREFYGAITSAYPVDAALSEARKAIFGQSTSVEWGTPVLYMRSPDGRIFDLPAGAEDMLDSSIIMPAVRPPAALPTTAPVEQKPASAVSYPVAAETNPPTLIGLAPVTVEKNVSPVETRAPVVAAPSKAVLASPVRSVAATSAPAVAVPAPAPVASPQRQAVPVKARRSPLIYLGIGGGVLAAIACIAVAAMAVLGGGSSIPAQEPVSAPVAAVQEQSTEPPAIAAGRPTEAATVVQEQPAEAPATTRVPPTEAPAATPAPPTNAPTATRIPPTEAPTATRVPPTAVPAVVQAQPTVTPAAVQATPTVAKESRDVTETSPAMGQTLKDPLVTFTWSGGALQAGEKFMVQIIPGQANKGGCTPDYGNAGLIFSPGLTDHQWKADLKNPPAGKAQACPGRIEWIVHIIDAAGKIIQSTPLGYFDWNPL